MTTRMLSSPWAAADPVCLADDRERWLEARRSGVGASDSPVLLGLSTFASVIELWADKRGVAPEEDDEPTERQHWGNVMEPRVAERYERKTGRRLARCATLLRSRQYPFMLATPDYYWQDGDEAIPVEIKTTAWEKRSEWADGAPPRVSVQCHHQMLVTGASRASVGLLAGGNQFLWTDVERDEALARQVEDACQTFWGLVTSGTLPPVGGDERTRAALKVLFPRAAEGETLTLPQDAVEWTRHLQAAQQAEKMARQAVTEFQNKLIAAIGNAEVGVLPDGSGAWTYTNGGREAYAVPAAKYRTLRLRK